MNQTPDWLRWSRRLEALAQIGLTYSQSEYDRERYEEIRQIAAEIGASNSDATPEQIIGLYAQDVEYPTPKVDVRGAVFRDNQILLVREASDSLWTLPGGWADINDTPATAVEREIREESGYEARAIKLMAAYDRDKQGHPPFPHTVYKLFFLCELQGGDARTSHETSGVGFFSEDALPDLSLGRVNARQIARFFVHMRQPDLPTDFD